MGKAGTSGISVPGNSHNISGLLVKKFDPPPEL